jgi:hypothetical protein
MMRFRGDFDFLRPLRREQSREEQKEDAAVHAGIVS